jgi:hypothetical protein
MRPAYAMTDATLPPLGPTAAFELVELVVRMNALERKAGKPEKWDRWNIRTFLRGMGVSLRQSQAGGKLYVTWTDLKRSGLLDSMLDAENDLDGE